MSIEKLKAISKTKRGVLTRGLKSFERFLQSGYDLELILKSYEKVYAVKQEMDMLIDQLTTLEDFPSYEFTEELKTHKSYSINFEKMVDVYYEHMNKVYKQNELVENIHKSFRQAAEATPGSRGTLPDESSNTLNIKYKPIEIPTLDPAKTEILSFYDWITLYHTTASALPDLGWFTAVLASLNGISYKCVFLLMILLCVFIQS